jgi:hypothetical protein
MTTLLDEVAVPGNVEKQTFFKQKMSKL